MLRMRTVTGWLLVAISLWLAGCAGGPRMLMPTPRLYQQLEQALFVELAPSLQGTEVELLYVTDREPETDQNGNLRYGFGRSSSLAFGTVTVTLGESTITWEDLLEASRTDQRLNPVHLSLGAVTEIARLPPDPFPHWKEAGKIVYEPTALAKEAQVVEQFRQTLARRLELTPRKEVFVYVHGYHNTFQDAAFAMSELWHFLGREGVPIVYTWPAGYPGLFGYTHDRESSEFTVFHLKRTLRTLSSFPEVERIHLIAHSRGTDVALAALRELTIWAWAAGLDPEVRLKLHNLVLAAADIDLQVLDQRVAAEHIPLSVNRTTIYASPNDKAIGYAEMLFASPGGRLGTVEIEDLTDVDKAFFDALKANMAIVIYDERSNPQLDEYGHSYFRNSPGASSDLILMLRDDLDPGSEGRPLESLGMRFWRIPQGYPTKEPAQ